ncbi:MAG: DinB family protein [Calditrichaeota bacterium]|nr:DinB family protein [Calditrichota bacterium]MCB9365626.1 DinB family protein [Calditrichota bacterium]
MNELSSHLKQIQKAFSGEAWHGPSLMEALDGVDAYMAKRRWVDGGHTIWELTLHTVAWKRAVTHWLEGKEFSVAEDENFPRPEQGDDAEWQHVLNEVKIAQAELTAVVSRLPNEKIYESPPGRQTVYSDYLFGIVHHDLYHAGQIMLLKRAAEKEVLRGKVK